MCYLAKIFESNESNENKLNINNFLLTDELEDRKLQNKALRFDKPTAADRDFIVFAISDDEFSDFSFE